MVILQKRVAGLKETTLARFVLRARQLSRLKGTVDVLVTSNAEMRSLNRRFRGKDSPTDVLSFPAALAARQSFAGEIAISAEVARQNARELGHAAATEIKILALHGILHLRGYDHERDNGRMAKREAQLRARLRLPVGLIERASGSQNGRARRKEPR